MTTATKERSIPLYSVTTWDTKEDAFTPQEGLTVPSQNVPLHVLREALRQLRKMGYGCYRKRSPQGDYWDNDVAVLVERTDGQVLEGQR